MTSPARADRVACVLAGGRSFDRAVERVRLAETLGYEAVFVPQLAGRDALTVVTAFGLRTERIRVGTGVVPIYARTPASMAQAAATIDELVGGRLNLGIGVSHRELVAEWHGQHIVSPIAEMDGYLQAARAIVSGEAPPPSERWHSTLRLAGMEPRPELRIYVAAMGPRMLELAGRLADGAILYMCSPRYIAEVALPALARGCQMANRRLEDLDVVPVIPVAATDDRDAVIAALQRDLAPYLGLPFYRTMLERHGHGDALARYDAAQGDPAAERAAVTESVAADFAAFGSAKEIRQRLGDYRDAGASLPCVAPVHPFDAEATLRAAISAES